MAAGAVSGDRPPRPRRLSNPLSSPSASLPYPRLYRSRPRHHMESHRGTSRPNAGPRDIIKLYCPRWNSERKLRNCPWRPECISTKTPAARVIYVGKAKSLRLRVRSYFSDDRLADVKTGTLISEAHGCRLHSGRQRKRGAGARKQPDQAVEAALQHPAARRQDLSVHQADEREISARVRDAAAAQGRLDLLRSVLSGQPGASAGELHSPPFSGAVVQGGSDALPSEAVPAVPHSPLPGAVRGGTDDRRRLRAARCGTCRLFLEGRHADLAAALRARMQQASDEMRFEEAAALRDLLSTVEEMEERQKMAAAKGDDTDIFACYAEPPLVAAEPVPPAQRADRGPARILLGGPAWSSTSRSSSRRC